MSSSINSDKNNSTHKLNLLILPILVFADCTQDQFECESGRCIPKEWHCDGKQDCGGDGRSEELNCGDLCNCSDSLGK